MKSGLTYEQVQAIITADAVETIKNAKGGLRKNGAKIQVYFNYQSPDPSKPTGKKQVRVSRQTAIDAKELSKKTYQRGKNGDGAQRRAIINAFRNDILEDVKTLRGVQSDPTSTVGSICHAYIDWKLSTGTATKETGHGKGVRTTTASSMKKQLKRLERYPLYDMKLTDITPVMVQEVVNDMCLNYEQPNGKKGLSGASVQGTISILRCAARWCLGARADLPTDSVTLPSVKYKGTESQELEDSDPVPAGRKNIVVREDIGGIIAMCEGFTGTLEGTGTAAILALTCGLREGECCGLRWSDIHLDADEPYLEVRRSINTTTDEEGHRHYFVGKPKSRASVRNVPIPPAQAKFLRKRRVRTLEALLALDITDEAGKPSIGDLYVIGDLNGNFKSPDALGNSWRSYCKRHEVHGNMDAPLNVHQLRDSYASALIDAGVAVLRVSHLLGHETIDITIKRYVFGNDRDAFESIANHADLFAPKDVREVRDGTNG